MKWVSCMRSSLAGDGAGGERTGRARPPSAPVYTGLAGRAYINIFYIYIADPLFAAVAEIQDLMPLRPRLGLVARLGTAGVAGARTPPASGPPLHSVPWT